MEGAVSFNKELVDGTVPSNKELVDGTVPSNSTILNLKGVDLILKLSGSSCS